MCNKAPSAVLLKCIRLSAGVSAEYPGKVSSHFTIHQWYFLNNLEISTNPRVEESDSHAPFSSGQIWYNCLTLTLQIPLSKDLRRCSPALFQGLCLENRELFPYLILMSCTKLQVLDLALQLTLTRALKLIRRGEMLQTQPLHPPCKISKIIKEEICQSHLEVSENHTVRVFHWAASGLGKQPASF